MEGIGINAYAVGLVISMVVYLAVGQYAGRKVKHLEDYFVAGRNAPTLLIVGTLVAHVDAKHVRALHLNMCPAPPPIYHGILWPAIRTVAIAILPWG